MDILSESLVSARTVADCFGRAELLLGSLPLSGRVALLLLAAPLLLAGRVALLLSTGDDEAWRSGDVVGDDLGLVMYVVLVGFRLGDEMLNDMFILILG